jgi:hypothetical protein
MFIATTLLISTPIVQSPRQPSTAESAHIFRIAEAFRRQLPTTCGQIFPTNQNKKTAAPPPRGFRFDTTRITGSLINPRY